MAERRQAGQLRRDRCFKRRQFTAEAILWTVLWYPMVPVSYLGLELMLLDRGGGLDRTAIRR